MLFPAAASVERTSVVCQQLQHFHAVSRTQLSTTIGVLLTGSRGLVNTAARSWTTAHAHTSHGTATQRNLNSTQPRIRLSIRMCVWGGSGYTQSEPHTNAFGLEAGHGFVVWTTLCGSATPTIPTVLVKDILQNGDLSG